jgi:RNA polymerase sigma-70 factor (ECF subfamily)
MSESPGLSAAQWQALYRRLETPLYNLAFRYLWRAQDAEDAVHDAFLQLWARRHRVLAATADRYAWVAVLNLCRKRRRWARARQFLVGDETLDGLEGDASLEADAARREQEARLRAQIERLPEKLRAVLLLADFSDMGYEQIAVLLAIPAGTVASRRHLALQRLRVAMEDGS